MWHKDKSSLKERGNWIYLFDSLLFLFFTWEKLKVKRKRKKNKVKQVGYICELFMKKIKKPIPIK